MAAPERGPGGELAWNALLSVGIVLLVLGAGEAIARLVDLRPRPAPDALPAWVEERQLRREAPLVTALANSRLLSRYFELYEWDRHLFYRVRPHLELEMLDALAPAAVRDRTAWSVRTNADGFRDEAFSEAGAPGVFRLLVLGDSSTFGWGVAVKDAYPSILADELAQRRSGRPVEVLRLGVPGYSSHQGLELLRRRAFALRPNGILFSFGSNDRTAVGVSDRELSEQRDGWLGALQAFLHGSHAYETAVAWWASWAKTRGANLALEARREGKENVSVEESRANLAAAAALARERSLPFAFVSNCLDEVGLAVTREVATESEVPFVNGYEAMTLPLHEAPEAVKAKIGPIQRRYGGDYVASHPYLFRWLPDRCHPNEVGHHLIGLAVADTVEAWLE